MWRISDCHLVWGSVLALSIVLAADYGREVGRTEGRQEMLSKNTPRCAQVESKRTKCTAFLVKNGQKECQWWKRI